MKERKENNMLSMKELSLKNTIRSATVVTFATCYGYSNLMVAGIS